MRYFYFPTGYHTVFKDCFDTDLTANTCTPPSPHEQGYPVISIEIANIVPTGIAAPTQRVTLRLYNPNGTELIPVNTTFNSVVPGGDSATNNMQAITCGTCAVPTLNSRSDWNLFLTRNIWNNAVLVNPLTPGTSFDLPAGQKASFRHLISGNSDAIAYGSITVETLNNAGTVVLDSGNLVAQGYLMVVRHYPLRSNMGYKGHYTFHFPILINTGQPF